MTALNHFVPPYPPISSSNLHEVAGDGQNLQHVRPAYPMIDQVGQGPLNPHTVTPIQPPLIAGSIETGEEEEELRRSRWLPEMDCILLCGWQKENAHFFKIVHYTLMAQAVLGILIIVLVIHALLHLGWWTQRQTAGILASELRASI